MRIRATVAAVSGALALSALAVPAAHADGQASALGAAVTTSGLPYEMDVTFSDFKIGTAYKVGTTKHVAMPVSFTLTHAEDINIPASDFKASPYLYSISTDNPTGSTLFGDKPATCTATSSTVATCKGNVDVHPDFQLSNRTAGRWKAGVMAYKWNGQQNKITPDITKVGFANQYELGMTQIQRNSSLTAVATPKSVKKGATVTVKGKLSRANWEDHKYHGYSGRVWLEFRKKGSNTYTRIKTVASDNTGNLKTTVKASRSGHYRFSYGGTSGTSAVNATGAYVAVK